ncbi:hypothetical protein CRV24_009684 [Beauveria bassiana]|nr:hypothetical protein CRV24_009684 [Beauveria bassiana]
MRSEGQHLHMVPRQTEFRSKRPRTFPPQRASTSSVPRPRAQPRKPHLSNQLPEKIRESVPTLTASLYFKYYFVSRGPLNRAESNTNNDNIEPMKQLDPKKNPAA